MELHKQRVGLQRGVGTIVPFDSTLQQPQSSIFLTTRKLVNGAFRRLHARNNADPRLDEDDGAEGDHVLRNIP